MSPSRTSRRSLIAAALLAGATSSFGAEPLRVCFLYATPVGATGWAHQHEIARRELEAAYGPRISTRMVENVAEGPDAERVMRDFVREGCRLVFAPSFGFMQPTLRVAREAPEVTFINGTGYQTASNVGVYNARYEEGRYLEGVIAGRMSASGRVGYVAAFPIPEVLQGINAFALGMRSVRPDAKVKVAWIHSWHDPSRERDAANALIGLSADTLAYATSGAATVAVGEAKGAWTLGYYSDMSRYGPKTHLGSLIHRWGPHLIQVTGDVLAGRWQPTHALGGFKEGMLQLSPLNTAVPATVREEIASLERDIVAGRKQVFAGPWRDRDGRMRVAQGASLPASELANMDYFVEGVEGSLPRAR